MNILVLNAGSSSLRFQLVRTDQDRIASDADERIARGIIDRIGGEALIRLDAVGRPPTHTAAAVRDHSDAIETALRLVGEAAGLSGFREIDAVGHRVVHGGERFTDSVLIDDEVITQIENTIDLAPLHNPHNLKGIRAIQDVLGRDVPQVAVFDTAFHHTLPHRAYLYALPYWVYRRHRVRRYGFHGTSHRYVAYRYRRITGTSRENTRIITLHLGNGCSACAIAGGESQDTSMGFTPLEGLVMGSRSGDIDPAVLDYLAGREGLSLRDLELLLNKQSGLLGISGLTSDMRELLAEAREHDDRRARLAIDIFCYRARKYIGAYLAGVGGADAIVFTGGIGENSPEVRAGILQGLEWMGLQLDETQNAAAASGFEGRITTAEARLHAWVIPTDEELLIARDTYRLVAGLARRY
mgnify:CR=1 FL=1